MADLQVQLKERKVYGDELRRAFKLTKGNQQMIKAEDVKATYDAFVADARRRNKNVKILIKALGQKWHTIKGLNENDLDVDNLYDYYENQVRDYSKFKEYFQCAFYIYEEI